MGPAGSQEAERRGKEKRREKEGGSSGEEKGEAKREPCRGVSMPVFQGCSEICGCRLPAKVVGRLGGEEFPHFEAASSARSAWVRRLCAPRAAIVIQVMLHETNPTRSAVSLIHRDPRTRHFGPGPADRPGYRFSIRDSPGFGPRDEL